MKTDYNTDVKNHAKDLVENFPEFANDLYFALDEIFVKKRDTFQELTQIINNWVNPKQEYYGFATIEDAEDGSGDGILTFPEGLCEKVGWNPGDSLNIESSNDGTLVITKIN